MHSVKKTGHFGRVQYSRQHNDLVLRMLESSAIQWDTISPLNIRSTALESLLKRVSYLGVTRSI